MPSSTASCTPLTASHSTGRPCVNQRKKPASGASLTPTTSSELLKPSTGELSAIIGMLSAIDRNQCPQSIGTPVRNPRNPHLQSAASAVLAGVLRRGGVRYSPGETRRHNAPAYDRQPSRAAFHQGSGPNHRHTRSDRVHY